MSDRSESPEIEVFPEETQIRTAPLFVYSMRIIWRALSSVDEVSKVGLKECIEQQFPRDSEVIVGPKYVTRIDGVTQRWRRVEARSCRSLNRRTLEQSILTSVLVRFGNQNLEVACRRIDVYSEMDSIVVQSGREVFMLIMEFTGFATFGRLICMWKTTPTGLEAEFHKAYLHWYFTTTNKQFFLAQETSKIPLVFDGYDYFPPGFEVSDLDEDAHDTRVWEVSKFVLEACGFSSWIRRLCGFLDMEGYMRVGGIDSGCIHFVILAQSKMSILDAVGSRISVEADGFVEYRLEYAVSLPSFRCVSMSEEEVVKRLEELKENDWSAPKPELDKLKLMVEWTQDVEDPRLALGDFEEFEPQRILSAEESPKGILLSMVGFDDEWEEKSGLLFKYPTLSADAVEDAAKSDTASTDRMSTYSESW